VIIFSYCFSIVLSKHKIVAFNLIEIQMNKYTFKLYLVVDYDKGPQIQ